MRILALVAGIAALATSQAGFAASGDLENVVTPSAADYAAASQLIDPIIARLIDGDARTAISYAYQDHPLDDRVAHQLPTLVEYLTIIYELYGSISACEQAQRASVGSMAIRLVYMCQHETYVSRWDFQLVKAKGGYILGNLKINEP